jgi:hypothetical protein
VIDKDFGSSAGDHDQGGYVHHQHRGREGGAELQETQRGLAGQDDRGPGEAVHRRRPFRQGQYAPKVRAIIRFPAAARQPSSLNPENLSRALKGETGTWIVNLKWAIR